MFKLSRSASWMPGLLASFGRPRAESDRADTVQLRQRVLRQEATIARLKEAMERVEARSRMLRMRLDLRRHDGLSHQVLRQQLPIRASCLPLRSQDAEAAAARARCLQQTSTAYAAAIAGDADPTPFHQIEIDGLRWWVPLDESNSERVERARRQGFPYRAILQTRELAIGGIMLDLGANIGRTSIPRVMLGDVRAVYAAEPEPANYACLVRNVIEHGLEGFVLPDRVAIGAARGEGRLRRSRYAGGHRIVAGRTPADTVAVPVWPLDEWTVRLGIDSADVTFVKVDTQGSEVAVLAGARSLLDRQHVSWLVEVDPDLLRRAGTDLRELLELLGQHFSHYIDIGTPEPGPRVRKIADVAESLSYLGTRQTKTDLLLFHAA